LYTLEFGTDTIWPPDEKLPETFRKKDRDKIMKYGFNPGLGIKKLHELGYTGEGVSVAIIDQPLLLTHIEYQDRDIRYYKINEKGLGNATTSSHGPGMTSILVGKNTGVAPESTVYYFANPTWLGDQKNEADAIRKVIELNKKLPENKKIRVISLSHGVDRSLTNWEMLQEAIKEAEAANIILVDVNSFLQLLNVTCLPWNNKDNPESYQISKAFDNEYIRNNPDCFFVPTGGKTIAYGDYDEHYFYQTNSGVSSAVPYVAGLIALGLQADPTLTRNKALKYLKESAYKFHAGKLINPVGFIEVVEKNRSYPKDVLDDRDYKYFLYNKNKVTDEDFKAIQEYISQFGNKYISILKDVSECKTAIEIYKILKEDAKKRTGDLLGIQIFGSSNDVPSFDINFKIQMENGIDEAGSFKSDHFYSNFNSENLYKNISIYDIFKKNLKVDFVPEWPVARLPLGKGEIAAYVKKYFDYSKKIKNRKIRLVDFSSPVFNSVHHTDDTGVLLNRMSEEFKLIDKDYYKLYGNLKGKYPVGTEVLGDFSKDSLSKENRNGIMHLAINSHGQWNNIDQYVVSDSENEFINEARVKEKNDKGEAMFRISLVNMDTINDVLRYNYYTLFSRSCLNAYELNNNNIIHEAMAKGKLISAMAHSSVGANNGMDVYASFTDLKYNNSAYYYMMYVYSLFSGNTVSDSFYKAKRAYVEEVLKHRTLGGGYGNYQFQLHNILSHNYLGMLEFLQGSDISLRKLTINMAHNVAHLQTYSNKSNIDRDVDPYGTYTSLIPVINKTQKEIVVFEDDNIKYGPIFNKSKFENEAFVLHELSSAVDKDNVYVKAKYTSPVKAHIGIRLAGDAPGLFHSWKNKTNVGENICIFKLKKEDIYSYKADVCIEVGDENSIVVDIGLLCAIAGINTNK
jgi:hypothetical protein